MIEYLYKIIAFLQLDFGQPAKADIIRMSLRIREKEKKGAKREVTNYSGMELRVAKGE